ncbi:MAG: mechanosensitive ion channel, partial [Firmicutes bacterium]|nr:mechanosensitive ion channel [Bacillota bacterium]
MGEFVRGIWPEGLSFDTLVQAGQTLLQILIIAVLARVAVAVSARIIDRVFADDGTRLRHLDERRGRTIASLVKSIAHYGIYFVAGVMILDGLGINTASLLAAAGVAGLAIGF